MACLRLASPGSRQWRVRREVCWGSNTCERKSEEAGLSRVRIFFFFFFLIFMYLFGCSGSSSPHVVSSLLVAALRMFLVVAYKLVATCGTSSLTRHQPGASGTGSVESQPLDHLGRPRVRLFFFFFLTVNNLVFYLPKASCCRH